jgi:glutamate N-acetyltransferase/amino-acid N-acetyltransferase
MATMLAFLTTDAAVSAEMLQKSLDSAAGNTLNMVSVDGDTSTNDMACILANGLAGNTEIAEENEDFEAFSFALMYCCIYLARMMAKDGEGAAKLIECTVDGAPHEDAARAFAKSVISSSLVKTAMFGADANWGRVLCALGYAGTSFEPEKVRVKFMSAAGEITVCENGAGVDFDEDKAKEILSEDEIEILILMNQGNGSAVAWGCDLTYDYVKINGDYRT